MSRLRSPGPISVALLLLVFGQLLTMPLSVSARSGAQPAAMPAEFEAPSGSVLLFSSEARGQQIYKCNNGQWAFHAPRAGLFDPASHQRTGSHYGGVDQDLTPGPWWESASDGSRIRGGNAISTPSPNPNSIPQLQLEVLERYGAGVFSQVSHIQRLNTVGGVGPTGACSGNEQRWVAYTADYYFYGNP
jgi:hypothetical protein